MLFERLINEVIEDAKNPIMRSIGHINGHNYYTEDDNIIIEVNAAGIKKKDIDVAFSIIELITIRLRIIRAVIKLKPILRSFRLPPKK